MCCDSWGRKESDMTERLNRTVISVTESDKVDQGSEFLKINLIEKDMVLV